MCFLNSPGQLSMFAQLSKVPQEISVWLLFNDTWEWEGRSMQVIKSKLWVRNTNIGV